MRTGRARRWVYPRVRGGTGRRVGFEQAGEGLSPRARGNLKRRIERALRTGSIPACAGEPGFRFRRVFAIAVYPRVRGGTCHLERYFFAPPGLSPRARGNPASAPRCASRSGSIPACAGEPVGGLLTRAQLKVYPRVRGGTARRVESHRSTLGLSPRARGNLSEVAAHQVKSRSIPACAGEPAKSASGELQYPVYPRVRGGTMKVAQAEKAAAGLSPRARGNHRRGLPDGPGRGSIPACAGEPAACYS